MGNQRLSLYSRWLLIAVIIVLAGCAGGPRELADRHIASDIAGDISGDSAPLNYAAYDGLSFSEYLQRVRKTLEQHNGLNRSAEQLQQISPFEMSSDNYSACDSSKRTGVLLIHGLTDTPFMMRDIAQALITHNDCLLVRAIVLPGHGTVPGDLLNVKYADWIAATNYGVESFSAVGVKSVFIAGYSTGGTLALNYALNYAAKSSGNVSAEVADANGIVLKGMMLFSPAIRIKPKGGFLANWHYVVSWASPKRAWFDIADDLDFAKYESFPKNAADQIHRLTTEKIDINSTDELPVPMFVVLSQNDDTINSDVTRQFFNNRSNENSRMMIYQVGAPSRPCEFSGTNRVCKKESVNAEHNIFSLSHTAIPVAPENVHYGENGDYKSCTHFLSDEFLNQYNDCMSDDSERFMWAEKSVAGRAVRRITFNPDFINMAAQMNAFVAANR